MMRHPFSSETGGCFLAERNKMLEAFTRPNRVLATS